MLSILLIKFVAYLALNAVSLVFNG